MGGTSCCRYWVTKTMREHHYMTREFARGESLQRKGNGETHKELHCGHSIAGASDKLSVCI